MENYRQARKILEAEIAEELVALDVDRDLCFGFNRPAAVVWKSLESPKTRDELVELLTVEFDVDEATCHADLVPLLSELERVGLIERA